MAFCLGNVKIDEKEGKIRGSPSTSILDEVRG